MTTIPVKPVDWAPRCALGESARWYAGRWWWIDGSAGRVFCFRPGTDRIDDPVAPWLVAGDRVSVVHPAERNSVLVAHDAALQFYDIAADGSAQPGRVLATLQLAQGMSTNDGAAGPGGGFYIGVVHPQRDPESGRLQYIRADGGLGPAFSGVGLSNGLALDPTGALMYHADSTERTVFAHRLDAAGEIVESSVHLRFSADDGMPDGLASDQDGGLWVAMYGPGEVRRYAADGRLDLTIPVPVPQVTSVALGGADGRDLLITTARQGYDEARSAAEPLAGRLFLARSPYAGRAVPTVARTA